MLGQYRGSKEKHKTNLIKIEDQNSYKELIEKTKKVKKRKRIGNNKTMKELKISDNIEVKEKKTKFSLGEIRTAKIHKEATKTLKQIKDLTKK